MELNLHQKAMLKGSLGKAPKLAMNILLDLAESIGAQRMIEVEQVHTDSGFYLGRAGLNFIEKLVGMKAHVAVTTTLNASAFDLQRGRQYNVPEILIAQSKRLEEAHLKMGALPTWTCAPYQDGVYPRFGSLIASAESNAILFANSIAGARTNRVGDLIDICAAITGCFPEYGLYLAENRKAQILIRLEGFSKETLLIPSFYPLLGYYLGSALGTRIGAVEGLPPKIGKDQLKDMCAAMAASGPASLIHLIGITPEAHTRRMCFISNIYKNIITVTPKTIAQTENKLWTSSSDSLDWVAFGCPHFSIQEFSKIYQSLDGRKVHPNVSVTVFTSRLILRWLKSIGLDRKLKRCGVMIFTDGCLLCYPQKETRFGVMMTNSAKAANYIYSQSGCVAAIGTIGDCVESAVTGQIIRKKTQWAK